jgi:hypothetical protein
MPSFKWIHEALRIGQSNYHSGAFVDETQTLLNEMHLPCFTEGSISTNQEDNLYCEWGAAHLLRNRGVFLDNEQAIVSQWSSSLRKGPLSSERHLDSISVTLDDMALRGGTVQGASTALAVLRRPMIR